MDDDELDTREAYRSTSLWFGALICPGVVVVDRKRMASMNRQRTFFDDEFAADMEAKRHARRTDPATSHQASEDVVHSGRLSRQCEAILERLQRGPATSAELAELALKYSGRISDLRRAGHKIQCSRGVMGEWIYFLYDAKD